MMLVPSLATEYPVLLLMMYAHAMASIIAGVCVYMSLCCKHVHQSTILFWTFSWDQTQVFMIVQHTFDQQPPSQAHRFCFCRRFLI